MEFREGGVDGSEGVETVMGRKAIMVEAIYPNCALLCGQHCATKNCSSDYIGSLLGSSLI